MLPEVANLVRGVAIFLAASASIISAATPQLALKDVTVIDATGAPAANGMTVLIQGDRISAIARSSEVKIPPEAQVVDGRGKFLIPGLWDMHMHLSLVSELAFPVLIANGITGVCDMGGDLDQVDQWRDQIRRGDFPGPTIIRAGPIMDGPRPEEGKFRLTVTNPEEGRQAVRSLKERGVDFVKVYHFLPRDSFLAIADEAHRQQMPVAGHIPNGVHPAEASDAGMRSAEHAAVLIQALTSLAAKDGRSPKEITLQALSALEGEEGARIFTRFAKNKTWHTPTLVVARSFLLRTELAAKPDLRRNYVAAIAKEHWEKHNPVPANLSPEELSERRRSLERMMTIVAAMQRAGVSILAGTDPPTRDVFPGFSLHDELGLLVQAGLSPMQALQAATRNAAACLGLADSRGTIEKGRIADLVLLEANPLNEIENTKKIGAVILRGKVHSKPALEEMLKKVEAAVGQK